MKAAASFSSFSRRPVITTWAPSSTKRLAVASPIPLLPPVTTTTFPASLPMVLRLLFKVKGPEAGALSFACNLQAVVTLYTMYLQLASDLPTMGPMGKARSDSRQSGCPVAFTLDTFGDKWSILVVRDMMLNGKKYYGEFLESPERIASNILAERLKRLEEARVITKQPDPE